MTSTSELKEIIKYQGWKNHLIGLVKDDKDNYHIFIAPETGTPKIESESFNDRYEGYIINSYTEHKITIPLFPKHGHIFYTIQLKNKEEYETILKVLETIL